MFLPDQACFDNTALYWLSVSSGVKITQQGFLFLDGPVIHGGQTYPCPRVLGALCQYQNYTFLPCTDQPRTMLTDAPPPFDTFWQTEAPCGKTPSLYALDVTPCDLVQGTSIVWADGVISVQHDLDMGYWTNLITMIAMIWLIINLGETIALILEVSHDSHHHSTVLLCLLLLAVLLINTPNGLWATSDDVVIYWSTVAYVAAYALYHVQNPNTVNVIVGCMILVASRWYQTNENPYTGTFLFIIATRWVQKAHYVAWGKATLEGTAWAYARILFMVADAALAALLFVCAYAPAFPQHAQAHMYLLGMAYTAYCLGSFISYYVRLKTPA